MKILEILVKIEARTVKSNHREIRERGEEESVGRTGAKEPQYRSFYRFGNTFGGECVSINSSSCGFPVATKESNSLSLSLFFSLEGRRITDVCPRVGALRYRTGENRRDEARNDERVDERGAAGRALLGGGVLDVSTRSATRGIVRGSRRGESCGARACTCRTGAAARCTCARHTG